MKLLLLLSAAAAVVSAGGLKDYRIYLNEYLVDTDCILGDAIKCIQMGQPNKKPREIWKCWAAAPSKCFYRLDTRWSVQVPQKGICKTKSNQWVIDISGYRMPFQKHAHTGGLMNFRYTGTYDKTCDPWLYTSTLSGTDPVSTSNLGTCTIRPVNDKAMVPVWLMKGHSETYNWVTGSGADFVNTHNGVVVLEGITDACYTKLTSFDTSSDFHSYSLMWGSVGIYSTTTTPAPTTTKPTTSTTTTTTSFISTNPIEVCQFWIASQKDFPDDHCHKLCEYYYPPGAGGVWCGGAHGDGEKLLSCVIQLNPRVCYDTRKSALDLPASEDYPVANEEVISECRGLVSSVDNTSPYTEFCKNQCEYFATTDGCKHCVGSNPSADDLVDCVATRNDYVCLATSDE